MMSRIAIEEAHSDSMYDDDMGGASGPRCY